MLDIRGITAASVHFCWLDFKSQQQKQGLLRELGACRVAPRITQLIRFNAVQFIFLFCLLQRSPLGTHVYLACMSALSVI